MLKAPVSAPPRCKASLRKWAGKWALWEFPGHSHARFYRRFVHWKRSLIYHIYTRLRMVFYQLYIYDYFGGMVYYFFTHIIAFQAEPSGCPCNNLKCSCPPPNPPHHLPQPGLFGVWARAWELQRSDWFFEASNMMLSTLWWTNIAIENGHRNSGFSH